MRYKNISIASFSIGTTILLFFACVPAGKNKMEKAGTPAAELKYATNDTFKVRPLRDIQFESTPQRLKQGEYLTTSILMCFTCHSPRDLRSPGAPPFEDSIGSGGTVIIRDSLYVVIAPNITPDKETGAGNWTDDMLARAIREGVGHDGRALSWQMPYNVFRNLADEDLASVIVYLRSIPPIYKLVVPVKLNTEERSGIERSLRPLTEPVLKPEFLTPEKRGRYLVSIGECVGCHTSHSEYNPGILGGGNLVSRFEHTAFSANITGDSSGISYGEEGFSFVLRTGKGNTLSPSMPWVAFKNMTNDDIKAIYAYLHTIPTAQHFVSNQKPFTHCAICDQQHGLGEKNKRQNLAGIKPDSNVYNLYAGTYYNKDYNLTPIVFKSGDKLIFQPWENGPRIELIPQSETHFLAPGWILPVHFVKDKNGQIFQMVEESEEGGVYKKIK